VRVKSDLDLRRFPPVPRATKKFERLYDGRTAVERVNARLKVFWGADDGNISGARRFRAFVGVVMVVHAGFATLLAKAPRKGTLGKLHLGPVQKALAEAEAAAKQPNQAALAKAGGRIGCRATADSPPCGGPVPCVAAVPHAKSCRQACNQEHPNAAEGGIGG